MRPASQWHASESELCIQVLGSYCVCLLVLFFRSAEQHQKDEEAVKADGEVKVEKDVKLERSETSSKFLKVSKFATYLERGGKPQDERGACAG